VSEEEHDIQDVQSILGTLIYKIDKELASRGRYKRDKLSWSELAGSELARGSVIISLEEGVLMVGCKHSTYLQLLQLRKKEILQKIQQRYASLQVFSIRGKVESSWQERAKVSTPVVPERDAREEAEFRRILQRMRELGAGS
jgi:predicted nucleic acid-binding Zn ribbon protein